MTATALQPAAPTVTIPALCGVCPADPDQPYLAKWVTPDNDVNKNGVPDYVLVKGKPTTLCEVIPMALVQLNIPIIPGQPCPANPQKQYFPTMLPNNDANQNNVPDWYLDGGKKSGACDTDLDQDTMPDAAPEDTCVCSACVPTQDADLLLGYFDNSPAGKSAKAGAEYYRVTGKNGQTVDDAPDSNCGVSGSCTADGNTPDDGVFVCLCLDPDGDKVCGPIGTYEYGNYGTPAVKDNCPLAANPGQEDGDQDGIGNACDDVSVIVAASEGDNSVQYGAKPMDNDGDGIRDSDDNCPTAANPGQEQCGPYFGCACGDADGDGAIDYHADQSPLDNCPEHANTNQKDADKDGRGDACDPCPQVALAPGSFGPGDDNDNDGIEFACDKCPTTSSPANTDADKDGIGDACDPDAKDDDFDGVSNGFDNCPKLANPDQKNSDKDILGNPDSRGDDCDNCPQIVNSDQKDYDSDGIGDVCDQSPCGGGVANPPGSIGVANNNWCIK